MEWVELIIFTAKLFVLKEYAKSHFPSRSRNLLRNHSFGDTSKLSSGNTHSINVFLGISEE